MPWATNFIYDIQVYLQNIKVKFVYQGHRVKVKVNFKVNVNFKVSFNFQALS